MKLVIRHRNPLRIIFRGNYKPSRVIRVRPGGKLNFVFRPVNRFGAKPQLTIVP